MTHPRLKSTEPDDRFDLPLTTKQGNLIPNERRMELPDVNLTAALELVNNALPPNADRRLRSISSTYNCVGMVLASRRTEVHPRHVRQVLEEDGYLPVADLAAVEKGDVVVYVDAEDTVQHVGVVMAMQPDLRADAPLPFRAWILSKWGAGGEYLHWADDVLPAYGVPHYYSERKILP